MNDIVSAQTLSIDNVKTPITEIDISSISVPDDRARALDMNWVEALAQIIESQGLTNAITVRQYNDKILLVSGAHRLAAFKKLGRSTIPARVSSAENDNDAKLEEVMENLGRNELNALDRCHHLYDLKTVYEKLHPETKHGGDRGNQYTGAKTGKRQTLPLDTEQPELFGFSRHIAEKIGLSDRSIRMAVAIWKGLSVASRRRLENTWIATNQSNLKILSEQTPVNQDKILNLMLVEPVQANSVIDALTIIDNGRLPDGQEKRFQALSNKLSGLTDFEFDIVLKAQAERVIAWAKNSGLI